MEGDYELGAQRKRRTVTTYGKFARKRQQKTAFTPSMSDEDPIAASGTSVAYSHSPLVSSPKLKSSPAHFKRADRTRNTQTTASPTSLQNITNSHRKRKISQIYKSREPSQPVTGKPEEGATPVPEPRRSRTTYSENAQVTEPSGREHARVPSRAPSGSVDIEAPKPRLSSPPPTPTPPRVAKPAVKAPSSHAPRNKPANVTTAESTQKRAAQRYDQIPLHLARGPVPRPKPKPAKGLAPPAASEQRKSIHIDSLSSASPAKRPRKRLIDVLVEQEPSDETTAGECATDPEATLSQITSSHSGNVSELDNQNSPETPKSKNRVNLAVRTFVRSSSALKFTYGQGRKVLEEEDSLLESLALPEESPYSRRRLDLRGPKKPTSATGAFDFEDDDGTTTNSPSSKLRGIHELRQAGANSRVADAMQDLVDQIGKPGTGSSTRRAALLQVAERMRDKTFIRQCLDHGVESIILKDIGKETDIICAYLIFSLLVMITARGLSAHLGRLLSTEEAGPIFGRLLGVGEEIRMVARDRKSNLSKRSQSSVVVIEGLLQELPIWDGHRPTYISPRNLAIKCLQLLVAQDVLIGRDPTIFTEPVMVHLFRVLSEANGNSEYWEYPKTARSIELCGALSVLDAHAVSLATTQGGNSEWAIPFLPTIADAFYTSLQMPAHDGKRLEDSILKLTINVANNNLAAPGVFSSRGVLPVLTASISSDFHQVLNHIAQDTWAEEILNSLLLRLGILINFAEHSELVRQTVDDCQHENRKPIKELIDLFIENHRQTGEADSIQKTHLNVAFGYLAVLLGYLALHRPIRKKVISSHPAKSISPLVESIREFIAHYEQVENALSESDDGHSYGGYIERLQLLVQQLRAF
ncbi:wings apart-like protein regulation of heterochromatin-domain-containing protein [Nemania sp. NC0429]|nr:wings apart-like protein regulation of heterochromatin-domain-containing protein [Nemania sp. NC0429]